jgi:hypothetical protein
MGVGRKTIGPRPLSEIGTSEKGGRTKLLAEDTQRERQRELGRPRESRGKTNE